MWAFARTDGFRSGALKVVNHGDDADTTGAVYGQIAGAAHSATDVWRTWMDRIALNAEITALADRLSKHGGPAAARRVAPASRV